MFVPLDLTLQTNSARSPKGSTNQSLNHVVTNTEFYANYCPFNVHPEKLLKGFISNKELISF